MRSRSLIIVAFLLFITSASFAQIVAGSCYLQGTFLEIGVYTDAAFGAPTAPTGYHPDAGTSLGEVYDWGHDGWTVGTPKYMGDYTQPGYPQEGWGIQVNGTYNLAYAPWGISGSGTLAGTITSYTTAGGRKIANWQGSMAGSLFIKQETRVDQNASWVTVTARFYNTGSTTLTGLYYMRTCDPDNTAYWPGGTTTTMNTIVHQNDVDHRVMVSAYDTDFTRSGYNKINSYLAIGTKDCRAKAFIISPYGLYPTVATNMVSDLYNQTGIASGYIYTGSYYNDVGIGVAWNLGNLLAGDSAIISYSYVFNGDGGIDSAHPDPELAINNVPVTSNPDTLNACLYPGVDSFPVNVLYGDDKDMSWSHWTWSPSIGLSATTGTSNYLHIDAISGYVTYTITGNDSAAGMNDCNHKVLIFTAHSCHTAYANSPCLGDSLKFGMLGDSTGASYVWYGPGGYVSGVHDPYRYPATWSDTGVYTVLRTRGGVVDSDHVHVIIHPLPLLTLSSNIPLCARLADSLLLVVSPDSIGETFSWTGPNGFTSTSPFPRITPFDSTGTGTYVVHATTQYGCKSTASINVYPGVDPNFSFVIHRGCIADTVYFTNLTTDANVYSWDFGDGSGGATDRNIVHIYTVQNHLYNVTLTASNAHCTANITHPVDIRHEIHAIFAPTPDTLCFGKATQMVNTSYGSIDGVTPSTATFGLVNYVWNFGDGVSYTLDTAFNPIYTYGAPGIYPARLIVTDSIGCVDSITHNVYVLQVGVTGFGDTTLCISQPLPLHNVVTLTPNIYVSGWVYQWTPAANLDDSTAQIPMFNAIGTYTYTDLVTLMPWGCTASYTTTVHSVIGKLLSDVTTNATIPLGSSIQLNADSEVLYYWKPNDGSLNNDNINNPIATPEGTTTYTVFGYDVNGCLDSANVTIFVDSTMTEEMPSGFTPDGDGLNDVFKPVGPQFSRMLDFRVYNRWGQELFSTNDKNHGWDGSFHGVPQDVGVYYYQIIVATADGGNKTYKGNITLIR